MKQWIAAGFLLLALQAGAAQEKSSKFPRVDKDLAAYDAKIVEMRKEFAKTPEKPRDKEWVKAKIAHMVEMDQYMRGYYNFPIDQKYSDKETEYFWKKFMPRFEALDKSNTKDLKKLTAIYGWFKISEFGEITESEAWLLVQHADLDKAFQKEILAVLEKLYPLKETKPANYAYLFDRVAAGELRPQRYGTQGRCVGPGKWEPLELEDPKNVDVLRKSVGLESMEEYKKSFKDICRQADGKE